MGDCRDFKPGTLRSEQAAKESWEISAPPPPVTAKCTYGGRASTSRRVLLLLLLLSGDVELTVDHVVYAVKLSSATK